MTRHTWGEIQHTTCMMKSKALSFLWLHAIEWLHWCHKTTWLSTSQGKITQSSLAAEQKLPSHLYSRSCSSLAWPDPIPHRGKGSGTRLQAMAKVRLATFLHSRFRFRLCCSSWLKTLLAQRNSHTSSSLSKQTEIWIFPLITYFRYHVTGYCAVIGTHSTVRGDKLLYGHIPDPFPRCGIGSGHARLIVLGQGQNVYVVKWLMNGKQDSQTVKSLFAMRSSSKNNGH